MIFKMLRPDRPAEILECDDLIFPVLGAEDFPEGLYGIHTGHEKAMFALGKGTISVRLGGRVAAEYPAEDGFIKFEDDTAEYLTASASKN